MSTIPTVSDAFAAFELALKVYHSELEASANAARPISREVADELFRHAAIVLLAYYAPQNWPSGDEGLPHHHFPRDLAALICQEIRAIRKGITKGATGRLLAGRGSPSNAPLGWNDRGWALAYVQLAKDKKIIKDGRHTLTAAAAFQVSKRAVEKWIEYLESKGVGWRDIVGKDVADRDVAEFVTAKLAEAGERHSKKARTGSSRKKAEPDLQRLPSRVGTSVRTRS